MNGLIDECFASDLFPAAPASGQLDARGGSGLAWELFAKRLRESSYSLEPDEGDVILTLFTGPMNGAFVAEAEAKVRELIDRIERGIFWPPSPKDAWRWDFADWIFNTPEESVNAA